MVSICLHFLFQNALRSKIPDVNKIFVYTPVYTLHVQMVTKLLEYKASLNLYVLLYVP